MKKFVVGLVAAAFILTGCSTVDPVTGERTGGAAQRIQEMLKGFLNGPLADLKADAQARIATIEAQVAAGRMLPIVAAQKRQCADNIVSLVDGIQGAVGVEIPPGAGIVWLMGAINDMQDTQSDILETQVKLTVDACKNQFNLINL